MNVYLYPWHTDDRCSIGKIVARNYKDAEEKLMREMCNKYDVDDTLEFEDFLSQLGDDCGLYIGDIYEIDEFM